jgi:UDP-N-acetylmuramoylalanine--D-glutamate ligase
MPMVLSFDAACGARNQQSVTGARPACPTDARPSLSTIDWSTKAVTIMGLGRHGGAVAAARYLALRDARVTISDTADHRALADSIAQLRDVPIAAIHLSRHADADFNADFVVVNPAVRPDHPSLAVARTFGTRLISEAELFLANCKAPVIGVSGTNGKSTTASMLFDILSAAGRTVWLGGNIGRSLLGELDRIAAGDWVVLELSSFQLSHLGPAAPLPEIAVITNCTPNHLDWHGSYGHYVAAKKRLLESPLPSRERFRVKGELSAASALPKPPGPTPVVVLNTLDSEAASWGDRASRRVVPSWPLEKVPPLAVPGLHNRQNAACAAAAATLAGIDERTIVGALRNFHGLRHRLELVAEMAGRRFYNDSKSTSPQATIAALDALDGPVWLLVGGDPKGASFDRLAGAIVSRASGAALFGAAREALCSAIAAASAGFPLTVSEHLSESLDWCWRRSRPGDAILLSPACASHDQFRDYQKRGEAFEALVGRMGT